MPGRPRVVDLEVRKTVSSELRSHLGSPGTSKSGFAREWKISRQMLYRYLNGTATPSTEVMGKLVRVPGLGLKLAGKLLRPEDFPEKPVKVDGAGVQMALDFDEPLTVALGPQNLTMAVIRKPNGRIEIRLDVTSAA